MVWTCLAPPTPSGPMAPPDPVPRDDPPADGPPPPTPETVFREYAPRIYAIARRLLNNDADAEDVTQDVLLQVVRKLHTFRGDAQLPTWLHRVTVNAALARGLGRPPFIVRNMLAVCQRVLNVDGYAVLGRDDPSDTVELDRPLLLRQFDLLAGDRP